MQYHLRVIVDGLTNRSIYSALGDRIAGALEFLASPKSIMLEPKSSVGESTRFDIHGDDVFALVQRYRTKQPGETFWEAHRKHIDVQCVVEGVEVMGFAPINAMRIIQTYDESKDFSMLAPCSAADVNYIRMTTGMFAIFFPHDAHMPGLAVDGTTLPVKKIVVKVRV